MNRRVLWWTAGIAGLAAVIALAVAFLGDGAGPTSTTTVASEFGTVTVDGLELPVLVDPAADPAVGVSAPVLDGQGFDGSPMTIGPNGRPQIVIFLAHWCPHCQREVPLLQQWIDDTGGNPDVDLVSVATASNQTSPNYPPSAWLEREGWTAPVMADDRLGTAATAYGLPAFPYWVGLDSEGKVLFRFTGELDEAGVEEVFAYVAENG
ncbi:MAG TPA: TlpA disulfide reductase family protein [Acidimicrobiia bacterium]|jgi:thiol-disulfide isomerase/thioredoxin